MYRGCVWRRAGSGGAQRRGLGRRPPARSATGGRQWGSVSLGFGVGPVGAPLEEATLSDSAVERKEDPAARARPLGGAPIGQTPVGDSSPVHAGSSLRAAPSKGHPPRSADARAHGAPERSA